MILIRIIANILWFIFGGLITAIFWCIPALLLCLTIVGIPFGLQCFKIARISLFPFGKSVDIHFGSHPIANTLWILLVGWWLAAAYFIVAIINFISIINIPTALYYIKIMKLVFCPFGAEILTASQRKKRA